MKKIKPLHLLATLVMLAVSPSFAPVQHGVHVELLPGSNKKIAIQIVPDKTYTNVVAHINFYSSDNKRVGQEAYNLSDDDKHVRKDVCTTRVFKFSFDKTVTRVTIDHVNEGEIIGDNNAKGKKLNLPVSSAALGPIEK